MVGLIFNTFIHFVDIEFELKRKMLIKAVLIFSHIIAIILAFIFNPVFPISVEKEVWIIIDIITGIYIVYTPFLFHIIKMDDLPDL